MLTVVCVDHLNYLGKGPLYVSRLRRMVEKHLTIPHQFVCLTEHELGTDLKGWWTKIKLAEPGRFDGDVLYMDLDVVITSNIDHLIDHAAKDHGKLWMRDDFSYSVVNPRQGIGYEARKLLGGEGCCNSSVMIWRAGAMNPVWEKWTIYSKEYMATCHGDQNVISQIMWPKHVGLLPNSSIQSYKYGIRLNNEKPAPIVVFHGTPKVTDLPPSDPLRRMWEAA